MGILSKVDGYKTLIGGVGFAGFTLLGRVLGAVADVPAALVDGCNDVALGFGTLIGIGLMHKAAKGAKIMLILLAFLPLTTGCASMQGRGLAAGLLDAAKSAGQGALEDANLKKHFLDFFNDLGDLFFGEPEAPEAPAPEVSAPPSETSTVSI